MYIEKDNSAKDIKDDFLFLKDIFFIINKKRFSIILFSLLTTFFGILYANIKKPVWAGEFQIVLRDENSNNTNLNEMGGKIQILSDIAGIEGGNGNIKTEVEILTSQSILRPIYDNNVKKSSKALEKPYLSYKKWLKSLEVNLKKGTNVLDISYRSKEKNTVLPILNKISKTYQDYSGQSRKVGLLKASEYLEEQIKLKTIYAKNSMDELQSFSILNKIGSFDGLPNPANLEPSITSSNPTNLKFETNNKIMGIDLFKDPSFNTGGDLQSTKQNRYKAQFLKLEQLETNLRELSAFYKPESERIKSLKKRIKSLNDALERPKEILIKYRELYRAAMRDENMLSNLEDELSNLKLLKSQQVHPWKLISTPTLIDEPVSPNKLNLLFLSAFLGLFSSSLFFIYKNYMSEIILSNFRLVNLLKFPLLKTFSIKFKSSWNDDIKLLIKNKLHEKKENTLGIIPLCSLNSENYSYFYGLLSKHFEKGKIKVSKDLIELENCDIVLLVVSQNESKYDETFSLVESLKLSKIKMSGWIFLEQF